MSLYRGGVPCRLQDESCRVRSLRRCQSQSQRAERWAAMTSLMTWPPQSVTTAMQRYVTMARHHTAESERAPSRPHTCVQSGRTGQRCPVCWTTGDVRSALAMGRGVQNAHLYTWCASHARYHGWLRLNVHTNDAFCVHMQV